MLELTCDVIMYPYFLRLEEMEKGHVLDEQNVPSGQVVLVESRIYTVLDVKVMLYFC